MVEKWKGGFQMMEWGSIQWCSFRKKNDAKSPECSRHVNTHHITIKTIKVISSRRNSSIVLKLILILKDAPRTLTDPYMASEIARYYFSWNRCVAGAPTFIPHWPSSMSKVTFPLKESVAWQLWRGSPWSPSRDLRWSEINAHFPHGLKARLEARRSKDTIPPCEPPKGKPMKEWLASTWGDWECVDASARWLFIRVLTVVAVVHNLIHLIFNHHYGPPRWMDIDPPDFWGSIVVTGAADHNMMGGHRRATGIQGLPIRFLATTRRAWWQASHFMRTLRRPLLLHMHPVISCN